MESRFGVNGGRFRDEMNGSAVVQRKLVLRFSVERCQTNNALQITKRSAPAKLLRSDRFISVLPGFIPTLLAILKGFNVFGQVGMPNNMPGAVVSG
ncbi:hypothetical protein MUCCIDRAFT_110924 [Mucor lusitanicus CBS 277.49]|uniref:Uncharacterized protein n=1 Tax=Mucor lusitanicus CBS 277.49 TaxID=747725 RepID=A0A168LWM3_MUCCL|nr:hypothetical protein MUCCIDRAFT_110924 [Mucor lusitanicus CBS 277.49]